MSNGRRLHPSSPMFDLIKHARGLILPGVIVIVFSAGGTWQIWLMALFVPIAIAEVAKFFIFRYELTDEDLIVTYSFIFRHERHVPLSRIQNVDTQQNALHRWLGVVEAKLQTSSGKAPEATLRVVTLGELARIRAAISGPASESGVETEGGVTSEAAEEAEPLLQLSSSDLVLLGIVTWRGLALLAVGLGVAWELQLFKRIHPIQWLRDNTELIPLELALVGVVLFVAGGTALLVGASILWAVLRFGGFRLSREGDTFRIHSGLLTTIGASVPRKRIQLVSLKSSPLYRLAKRTSIRLETAGGAQETETPFGRRWFAPAFDPKRTEEFAVEIRPGLSFDTTNWKHISPRGAWRIRKKLLALGVVLCVPLVIFQFWWIGGAVIVLLGLSMWWAGVWCRSLRYDVSERQVGLAEGVVDRWVTSVFADTAQVVTLSESPFDRRARMAKVKVDTAGALTSGHKIAIPYLESDEAHRIARRIAEFAATHEFEL